jgi:hypothetical protein
MVVTILEAEIAPERGAELEHAYREGTAYLPADILETFLLRHADTFRIMTIWRSREALASMRASGMKPKGVQIFEQIGAMPQLTVFDVIVRHAH